MDDNDLLHDDQALDQALGALPPAGKPSTSASDILAYGTVTIGAAAAAAGAASAATGTAAGAAPAITKGILLFKFAALLVAGASLGVVGDRIYQRATSAPMDDVAPEAMAVEEQVEADNEALHVMQAPPAPQAAEPAAADDGMATIPAPYDPPPQPPVPACQPVAPCEPVPCPEPQIAMVDDQEVEFEDFDWLEDAAKVQVPVLDEERDRVRPVPPTPTGEPERVVEVQVEKTHQGPGRPAQVRLHAGGGVATAGGIRYGPFGTPGPGGQIGLTVLGPTRGTARGLIAVNIDLLGLPSQTGTPFVFAFGASVGPGIAVDGPRLRFEASWAMGPRLIPQASGGPATGGPRRAHLLMGPQFGLSFKNNKRLPNFYLGGSVQGSVGEPGGDGQSSLLPWVGLVVGADFGVRKPDSSG